MLVLVLVLVRICMIMVHGPVYVLVCVLCYVFFFTAFPPRVVAKEKEHPIAALDTEPLEPQLVEQTGSTHRICRVLSIREVAGRGVLAV